MADCRISVVVPVYNEQEVLPELIRRLESVCDQMPAAEWQVIFVNDGSDDRTEDIIADKVAADSRFSLVCLSRNFGHQAALSAGLDHADGDAVISMDADLQDPPEIFPELIEQWKAGFDVVYAVRKDRREPLLLRLAYKVFYRLLRFFAKIEIPLHAGDFCLMDGEIARQLARMPERNRFLRGLRAWVGFRQTGVEYSRPKRFAGRSKYTLSKLVRLACDGFVSFSDVPLRLATWLGLAASAAGFLMLAWVFGTRFLGIVGPQGWTSLIAVVLFMSGVQLLVLGVIGEYLVQVGNEVRGRPIYLVHRRLGFRDGERKPFVEEAPSGNHVTDTVSFRAA
jgi:dolichol-phosphate mannosyltransferase